MPITRDRAVSMLVERQMRNWELARGQRFTERPERPPQVQEFICISRMVGVDHQAVSTALGERLGWPVFDRELLDAMAGDDDLRKRIYHTMDQRDLGWWEAAVRSVMDGEYVRDDYFHRLTQTLLSLARQGSCVFVGRGADLVLPRQNGLRVRLVAPFAKRVRALAEARGLEPAQARAEVERVERQRDAFIRGHFGVEASDPLRPDLTINLARLTPAMTVDLILTARAVLAGG